MAKYNEYLSSGVKVDLAGPPALHIFKIAYDGLLARSGATAVYAHVGFNSGWEDAGDYPMTRTPQGFETSVLLKTDADTLNVCFRDPAGNWTTTPARITSSSCKTGARRRTSILSGATTSWPAPTTGGNSLDHPIVPFAAKKMKLALSSRYGRRIFRQ